MRPDIGEAASMSLQRLIAKPNSYSYQFRDGWARLP
jgi:hypothetical protein